MAKRKYRLSVKLFALALGSLIALSLVEVGLRLTGHDVPRVWHPHAKLGWESIPGARRHYTEEGDGLIEINSAGFRDREREIKKPPKTYRIAVFGDSMTQAVEVNLDQTYCYRLEERLSTESRSFEVMNFGVIGYSPIQELLLFEEMGTRYSPDLVVLALFLDNDVSDCVPELSQLPDTQPFISFADGQREFDFSGPQRSYDDYHREPVHTIRRLSSIYRVIRHYSQRRADINARSSSSDDIPKRYCLYSVPSPPEWEAAWTRFERVLLEFVGEAHRQQIPLVVLSVPAAQVVSEDAWNELLKKYPAMKNASWDLDSPESRLRGLAEKHKFTLAQPFTEFRNVASENRLFFGKVGHMTAQGHMLMADYLEEFIRNGGLVERASSSAQQVSSADR